jgi:predicted RNA-binding protein with PUA-like domain
VSYWIFKANPLRFRIEEPLKDARPQTTWLVTRYRDEIKPGDVAFVWCGGREPGIRAVMRVDTRPEVRDELDHERPYWADSRDASPRLRVVGELTHRIGLLTGKRLKSVRGLEKLSVFHAWQQATNFRVTDAEGQILLRLVERSR